MTIERSERSLRPTLTPSKLWGRPLAAARLTTKRRSLCSLVLLQQSGPKERYTATSAAPWRPEPVLRVMEDVITCPATTWLEVIMESVAGAACNSAQGAVHRIPNAISFFKFI